MLSFFLLGVSRHLNNRILERESQGGDADETTQGGAVPLDDEDTLNLDDAGFSRMDLTAASGGGVGQPEEQKEEEENEVRFIVSTVN